MKRTELKKLIDLEAFYANVEDLSKECECTLLEAAQDYARIQDIDDDMLAQILKAARGKFKAQMQVECERLLLVK